MINMFTDYQRALITLDELNNTSDAQYGIIGKVKNYEVYEILEPYYDEYYFEVLGYYYWYMAIDDINERVKINSEVYDETDKPDISELLNDFEYFFN